MKSLTFICVLFALLLSACGSIQPAPTMSATATSLPTNTHIPTATATPIPMIDVNGIQVPDPKVTNPDLFDLKNSESPIVQFANAFGIKPEEVGNLTPKLLTSVDRKQFVVLISSSGYPLLITDKESHWKSALKDFTHTVNIIVGVYLEPGKDDYLTDQVAKNNFDDIVLPIFWHNIFANENYANWSLPDSRVSLAESEMGQFGGTLIWQNTDFLPEWFKNSKVTEEQVRSMIKSIIQKYPDVKVWLPVNEPYPTDFFASRLGYPNYVIMAFDEARKDTNAPLVLNDFDIEKTGTQKYNQTKTLVETLKSQNLIDGIGIQMHIDPNNPPSKEALVENFKSWGIDVYLTELDVPTDNGQLKAKIFSDVFSAAMEAGVVKQINIWGVGNAAWKQNGNLFNASAQPTIALFEVEKAVVDYLSALSPQ